MSMSGVGRDRCRLVVEKQTRVKTSVKLLGVCKPKIDFPASTQN
jgi:hypothetical protein